MNSATKSEPDFDESDEDSSLPSHADPTGFVQEVESESDESSTDEIAEGLEEEEEPEQRFDLPGTARKRGFDDIYQHSHIPVLSTTPQKTPPKSVAFPYRSAVEPQKGRNPFGQNLEKATPSALRNVMSAESPPASTGATILEDAQTTTTHEPIRDKSTFVQDIESFEKELDNDFKQFEAQLESRDRTAELAALDWDDLERRFTSDLDPLIAQEDRIRQELSQRLQVLYLVQHTIMLTATAIPLVAAGIE
jgi:hypothetical protein